jgi:hypothetical protein
MANDNQSLGSALELDVSRGIESAFPSKYKAYGFLACHLLKIATAENGFSD